MAVNNLDVYMVKAMCSNVKMEFDLAKANFLEIQEAMETFHGYLKRMEQMEKQHPNYPLDGELAHLKDAVNRAKLNMNVLRGKLAKNTNRAEEGYRLLTDRLSKVEEKLDGMVVKKRKCEDMYQQYKRLRTSTVTPTSDSQIRIAERQSKLLQLETNLQEADDVIDSTAKEKQVLREACDKMQVFLEDTKGVLNHFKDANCPRKRDGVHLFQWCTDQLSKANLHLIREHCINENEIAFEYINLPTMVAMCPRLVVTTTFAKMKRGLYPYSLIGVKANVESLSISDLIDLAIEQNDFVLLLTRIQSRWLEHIPLFNEIVKLRDKYAIDWLVEQHRLRFMLGFGGKIICTLVIPPNYPHKGSVTLEQINGVESQRSIDTYVPKDDVTITGWLNYLSNLF